MKNSNDTAGIEPASFRFVVQRLNHCATAVLTKVKLSLLNKDVWGNIGQIQAFQISVVRVLFYVLFCVDCVVLCTVCVSMCTVLLPPGVYPIAVKYIISEVRRFKPLLLSQEKCTRCQVAGGILGQKVAMNTTEQYFCPRQVSNLGHPIIRNLVVLLTVVLGFVFCVSSNNQLKIMFRPINLRRSWQFSVPADRIENASVWNL